MKQHTLSIPFHFLYHAQQITDENDILTPTPRILEILRRSADNALVSTSINSKKHSLDLTITDHNVHDNIINALRELLPSAEHPKLSETLKTILLRQQNSLHFKKNFFREHYWLRYQFEKLPTSESQTTTSLEPLLNTIFAIPITLKHETSRRTRLTDYLRPIENPYTIDVNNETILHNMFPFPSLVALTKKHLAEIKNGLTHQGMHRGYHCKTFNEDDKKRYLHGALGESLLNHFTQSLNNPEETIPEDSEHLKECYRHTQKACIDLNRRILSNEKSSSSSIENVEAMFNELIKMNMLRDFRYNAPLLTVITQPITITDLKNNTYHGGQYQITLNIMDGSNLILNLTQPRFNMMSAGIRYRIITHPHIRNAPCYGNSQEVFYQAIHKKDLFTAIYILIAFLQQANDEDPWGKDVEHWEKKQ